MNRPTRRTVLGSSVIVLAMLAASCGSDDDDDGAAAPTSSAAAPQTTAAPSDDTAAQTTAPSDDTAAETTAPSDGTSDATTPTTAQATPDADLDCLVGGAPPLTGNAAAFGELFTSGMDLAVTYIGDHTDVYAPVHTDYRDGQALPGPTVQAVQAFAAEDATGILLLGTDALVAADPVGEEEGIIIFNVAATTTAQREMSDFVFGNALIADVQIREWFTGLTEELDIKTIGVIRDDNELGEALTREIQKQAPDFGLELSDDDIASVTVGGTDFRTELRPLTGKSFDVIFLLGSGAHPGTAVRQAKEIGIEGTYWVAERTLWNADSLANAGEAAEGSLQLRTAASADSSETAKWFFETYEAENGEAPSEVSRNAFDGVLALARAAKIAGSCDSDAVRQALLTVTDLEGAAGTLDFSTRFAEPAVGWGRIEGGEVVPVELADVAAG